MKTPCRAWGDMDCPWDGTGTTVVTLGGEENVGREEREKEERTKGEKGCERKEDKDEGEG